MSATLLPGLSEVSIVALAVAGLCNPYKLICCATFGNWLGGVFTYLTAWLFGFQRLADWFSISSDQISGVVSWVQTYGGWAGIAAWMPVVGDPLVACLGLLHTSPFLTLTTMFVGKALRYAVLLIIASRTTKSLSLSLSAQ